MLFLFARKYGHPACPWFASIVLFFFDLFRPNPSMISALTNNTSISPSHVAKNKYVSFGMNDRDDTSLPLQHPRGDRVHQQSGTETRACIYCRILPYRRPLCRGCQGTSLGQREPPRDQDRVRRSKDYLLERNTVIDFLVRFYFDLSLHPFFFKYNTMYIMRVCLFEYSVGLLHCGRKGCACSG